jgi:hypothetical protein
MEGERSVATSTYHLRVHNEPAEIEYRGEIVGYWENTIVVEDDPEAVSQRATFMEVNNISSYDSSVWSSVYEGVNHTMLKLIDKTPIPHREEPKPPVRSKSE